MLKCVQLDRDRCSTCETFIAQKRVIPRAELTAPSEKNDNRSTLRKVLSCLRGWKRLMAGKEAA